MSDISDAAITLVGTAHVSPRSRTRVIDSINRTEPDVVAVELDPVRYKKLVNPDPDSEWALAREVLSGRLSLTTAVVTFALEAQQKQFGDELGVDAGEADFLPAICTAREVGSRTAFIDARGDDTLEQLGESLEPTALVENFLRQDFITTVTGYAHAERLAERNGLNDISSPQDAVERLEAISYKDLEALLNAYDAILPGDILGHLIHGRNEKMAGHLHWLREEGHTVVAVMGRAHVPGVKALLERPTTISEQYLTEPEYLPDE